MWQQVSWRTLISISYWVFLVRWGSLGALIISILESGFKLVESLFGILADFCNACVLVHSLCPHQAQYVTFLENKWQQVSSAVSLVVFSKCCCLNGLYSSVDFQLLYLIFSEIFLGALIMTGMTVTSSAEKLRYLSIFAHSLRYTNSTVWDFLFFLIIHFIISFHCY